MYPRATLPEESAFLAVFSSLLVGAQVSGGVHAPVSADSAQVCISLFQGLRIVYAALTLFSIAVCANFLPEALSREDNFPLCIRVIFAITL